jgi:predicted RNA methylase
MTGDAVREAAQSSYAERFAEQYDEWFGFAAPTADTVDLLHGLAGSEPVLELGIGTGRVALLLSARGVQVQGVEGPRGRWRPACVPSAAESGSR